MKQATKHYRIDIRPGRLSLRIHAVIWGAMLCSVFTWQSGIHPDLLYYQLVLAGLLLVAALIGFIRLNARQRYQVISLSDDGLWSLTWPVTAGQWQMTSASRFSPWLAWIVLQSVAGRRRYKRLEIYRDQLNDGDYRRLCRIIRRCQQQSGDKPG